MEPRKRDVVTDTVLDRIGPDRSDNHPAADFTDGPIFFGLGSWLFLVFHIRRSLAIGEMVYAKSYKNVCLAYAREQAIGFKKMFFHEATRSTTKKRTNH